MLKKNNSSGTAHKRAVFFDKLAKYVINLGGVAVIIAVTGILVFILWESIPLLFSAQVTSTSEAEFNKLKIIGSGIDEYQEIAFVITDSAAIEFFNLEQKKIIQKFNLPELEGRKVISAGSDLKKENFALGLDSGYVALINVHFNSEFKDDNQRIIHPETDFKQMIKLDSLNRNVNEVQYTINEDGFPSVAAFCGNDLIYYSYEEEFSLFGDGEKKEYFHNFSELSDGIISVFALSPQGDVLAIINTKNNFEYISLTDKESPKVIAGKQIYNPQNEKAVSAAFLLGNQSIVVGTDKGNISSWMKALDSTSVSGWRIVQTHEFTSIDGKITSIAASSRSKGFLAADDKGNINLYFLTSERLLLSEKGNGIPIAEINFSPKANGMLARFANGAIENIKFENPHPEISMSTLFGKVWYEGYQKPEFVWQSTGGDDSFESKFSLVPLIYGTFKGTFYAMIFAIPLALLGALYTSTFSHPKVKNKIKPFVELMAALPSVVIGFLAGLWLAPMLEKQFPGMILMLIIQPIMIITAVLLWQNFDSINKRIKRGYEVFLIMPFLILGGYLAVLLGPWFESVFMGSDYRLWLDSVFGIHFDQRNSIVVGFAMGFAVIPIIFTICEDALSSVPQHLTSASLALGATKWQTAIKVVLPSASPGIFSAIMIGFGRAIGETMIVLMATGNTPILNFSPFNGMRTLSANIAVEIPEAPYLGTLYRVLFVSAALLFVLTFIVNTIAEIVRQRLRNKYMHI